MKFEPVKSKLELAELPTGFSYPASFDAYLEAHPKFEVELDPWGATTSMDANARYSELYGLPLVMFAQAWLEDMIACFVVGTGDDPAVMVLNPWAQTLIDEEWKETSQVMEELSNFKAWLEWASSSELVRLYAEHRAEY